MLKRKNPPETNGGNGEAGGVKKARSNTPITIQAVAGSYDRVLHGVLITVEDDKVDFADSFLLNAHTSAIRCLALSPPSLPMPGRLQKVMLATGGTDEKINVYNLSAHPPSARSRKSMASTSLGPRPVVEDPKNRELGTLLHHDSTVTRLIFPNKSKLMSSSEDSTIAVTRTRDWLHLASMKAPIPKARGRPSGDTAPFGGAPSGVNDFAIHPSMKLMISVSKGERSIRLWNLMTGKKASVLDFDRDVLEEIGERKHWTSGEGRKVAWGSSSEGDEWAVCFDREIIVFSMEAKPRCRIMGGTKTQLHNFQYITTDAEIGSAVLAASTESGQILFFSTEEETLEKPESGLPVAKLVAQLGGKEDGVSGRIKDFAVVKTGGAGDERLMIIGGSSDGKLRVWSLGLGDLKEACGKAEKAVCKLLGVTETQNRITCVGAFAMIPRPDGAEESEDDDIDEGGSDDDELSDD